MLLCAVTAKISATQITLLLKEQVSTLTSSSKIVAGIDWGIRGNASRERVGLFGLLPWYNEAGIQARGQGRI